MSQSNQNSQNLQPPVAEERSAAVAPTDRRAQTPLHWSVLRLGRRRQDAVGASLRPLG